MLARRRGYSVDYAAAVDADSSHDDNCAPLPVAYGAQLVLITNPATLEHVEDDSVLRRDCHQTAGLRRVSAPPGGPGKGPADAVDGPAEMHCQDL